MLCVITLAVSLCLGATRGGLGGSACTCSAFGFRTAHCHLIIVTLLNIHSESRNARTRYSRERCIPVTRNITQNTMEGKHTLFLNLAIITLGNAVSLALVISRRTKTKETKNPSFNHDRRVSVATYKASPTHSTGSPDSESPARLLACFDRPVQYPTHVHTCTSRKE